jgi:hypothetical protein
MEKNAIGPIFFGIKMKKLWIFENKGNKRNKNQKLENSKNQGALDWISLIDVANPKVLRRALMVSPSQWETSSIIESKPNAWLRL